MELLDWLIEHFLEIILTIIGSTGVYYLIQINRNQIANINNSPNSQVLQVQKMDKSQINIFKKGLSKEEGIFGKVPSGEETSEDLLKRIQRALDDSRPLYIVAQMCLRLTQKLKFKEDEEWLNKEVYGFDELIKEEDQKRGMKLKKVDDKYSSYRSINTELNLQFRDGKIETFPLRMFMNQPLSQIESWIDKFNQNLSSPKELVMNAPPLEIMVETLNVSPEEKVPYIISLNELEKIVHEVRKKILKFLEKATQKLGN